MASTFLQAYEDAEILRSLVVQLEEEVSALKEKLRRSDDQLAAVQGAQACLIKGNDAFTHLFEGEDVQGVLTQFDDKVINNLQSNLINAIKRDSINTNTNNIIVSVINVKGMYLLFYVAPGSEDWS